MRTKKSAKVRVAHKKRLARVRVAHKAVDHGVAPERSFDQEAYTKKTVDLIKNKSRKGISDLA